MPEDPYELVEMYNAKQHTGDDPPVALTTRQAFKDTWKGEGFKLTSDRSGAAASTASDTGRK